MSDVITNKSLGQHWLNDQASLEAMCQAAELNSDDIVLEIGPGLGSLTKLLVTRSKRVIATEFDKILAAGLAERVPAQNLEVINHDILSFDFTSLQPDYKIVANIPYYLTSNLIRVLSDSTNRPSVAVLLVQKEVAERVAADPGDMSLLSVTAQYYWQIGLGPIVQAELFTPPPKVNSQVLILLRRDEPLFNDMNGDDVIALFRLVKAGFSERRKKLRSSLSGGLHLSKQETEALLIKASIDPNLRAQALSLQNWHRIYNVMKSTSAGL